MTSPLETLQALRVARAVHAAAWEANRAAWDHFYANGGKAAEDAAFAAHQTKREALEACEALFEACGEFMLDEESLDEAEARLSAPPAPAPTQIAFDF